MGKSQTVAATIHDIADADKAKLKLVGTDGNAFSIMGRAVEAMRKAKYTKAVIDMYRTEAMSGDYNKLLQVTMTYCKVC